LAARLRPWREHPLHCTWLWFRLVVFRPPLFAGLLLWMSFPPVDLSFLAWFALVPLAVFIPASWRSHSSMANVTGGESFTLRVAPGSRPIYRSAWAGGLVFGLLAVQWIRYADDSGWSGYYGWWALAFYMSLYFPLFLFIARIAVLHFRIPIIFALPIVWVGLEYLRSWLISGFPWYFLGHTQYRWISLIQISDFAGAYGASFLVALVNGWIVDLAAVPLRRVTPTGSRVAPQQIWRFGLVCAVILGSVLYGSFRVNELGENLGPRIAVMQSSIPQRIKEEEDQIPLIHQGYYAQIAEAVAQDPRLIVWPETAYRYPLPIVDSGVTDEQIRRSIPTGDMEPEEIREFARRVHSNLSTYAQRSGLPNLIGLNTEVFEPDGSMRFNSAILLRPNGEWDGPYHKIHLVPWGEYLPLRDILPWLRIFTPHASADYGLQSGSESVRFSVDSWTFGVLICFEDTLSWAARAYVSRDPVDFFVNISNDGWFGVLAPGETEAGLWRRAEHESHLAISVFRAIECRRPIFRAVNTGVSAIIDSNGRVIQSSGSNPGQSKLGSQIIVGAAPVDQRQSAYSKFGDWLGQLTFAFVVLAFLVRMCGPMGDRMRRRQWPRGRDSVRTEA
jgi:apolipoprotein N-acyltransferase